MVDTLLEDLRKKVLQPDFNLRAFETAFSDVPQNKRILYMLDLLECSGIKNPAAFKLMFVNILENKTSMEKKALLMPLLMPDSDKAIQEGRK
jgi:hypothetical protein